MRHRIILDCDPGIDDAAAILLALASPDELEVLAITAVAGNVALELTERNARALVELAGRREVPVHAGCAGPLHGPPITAEHVHGANGLGGVVLPEPVRPLAAPHAADAIVEIVQAAKPGEVTLVAVGPLTNLAVALRKEPRLAERLRRVVLMGGARDLGNVTPAAEFNIYVDPEAAAIVFNAGVPITMFGLDVTHQVRLTAARLDRLVRQGPAAAALARMFAPAVAKSPAVHDACPIAWLIEPALFAGRSCRVEIETEGRWCRGRTVVDWHARTAAAPNAEVMAEADEAGFFALFTERLARL
jgi:purine nucleosidase